MNPDATSSTRPSPAVRIAYQGEPGAFSEEAALTLGRVVPVPCTSFAELFSAIAENRADRILAPVENTIAGPVTESCDLLANSGLFVIEDLTLPIRLQLIGLPGAMLSGIRKVRSHPVALAQCRRYLSNHPGICSEIAADTAGSVREIFELHNLSVAAIASERAAALHGGIILDRDIHDNPKNFTRFLLLSSEPAAASGDCQTQGERTGIDTWREKIDAIDRDLVRLLNERATAARSIGRLKQQMSLPIYEPKREEIILKNVSDMNAGPLPSSDLHFIFKSIIAVMRAFQRTDAAVAEDASAQSTQSS
jgi:chorismate mutase-like protein